MKQTVFNSPSGEIFTLESVIGHIKSFINQDTKASYKLTIGSDSEAKLDKKSGATSLELICAIVIYRKGFGGRYFWVKKKMPITPTLRDKIYQEVLLSLEIAHIFVPELKIALNGQSKLYDLEIHIDVGEHGETREMIKEVVGMVTGFGYVAKTKPYSYAASNIADKHA